jgi:hypothetical protein
MEREMDEDSKRNRRNKKKMYIFFRMKFNCETFSSARYRVTVLLIPKLGNMKACGQFLAPAALHPGKESPVSTYILTGEWFLLRDGLEF